MEHRSAAKEYSIAPRDARSNIIVGSAKHNTDPIKALELPNSLMSSVSYFHGTERHTLRPLVYSS